MTKLDEAELLVGLVADQRKRVAADHLGEFDERRIRVLVVVLHDPDRPHPQHVDFAGGKRRLGLPRSGRRQQLDLEPFGGISAGRVRRIERRVEHEAVILEQAQTERFGHRVPFLALRRGGRSVPRVLGGLSLKG
jgi:hypothetical protein